jgi:hypothetical protein
MSEVAAQPYARRKIALCFRVMAGLVQDCPGHPRSRVAGKKDVDARDIGAKQSFVASPGHDGDNRWSA